MARNFVLGTLTALYEGDFGTDFEALTFRFKDTGDGVGNAILTAINATVREPGSNPCPKPQGFKPRTGVFIRRDGNSIRVPLPTRTDIVGDANAIIAAINGASAANPVICVKLEGEEWPNVMDILSTRATPPTAGTGSRTVGKQLIYSGKINYQSDGGANTVATVKVDTDTLGSPPTVYAAEWNDCVGVLLPPNPCPSRAGLRTRRWIATALVTDAVEGAEAFQNTEIPIASRVAQDIRACGVDIANNVSTACLAYQGESDRNFTARVVIA